MANLPDFLQAGDLVALVCPASFVSVDLQDARNLLSSWDLRVQTGTSVISRHHQYAGDDQLRTQDLQAALDNPDIKVIFAARGGYGTVRIIDQLDFTAFRKHPKWLVGFSDITVLHSHIHAMYRIPTIHGQMPVTIPDGTKASLETLRKMLFGETVSYQYNPVPELADLNKQGTSSGLLIGGNLALLHCLMGSRSEMDFKEKILFIEDVGEPYHNVDRMLWTLKRAGKLDHLAGLIVGGFTSMKDEGSVPFGSSVEEIVLEKTSDLDYPVAFGFPAGHIPDNHALRLGTTVELNVSETSVSIQYI